MRQQERPLATAARDNTTGPARLILEAVIAGVLAAAALALLLSQVLTISA